MSKLRVLSKEFWDTGSVETIRPVAIISCTATVSYSASLMVVSCVVVVVVVVINCFIQHYVYEKVVSHGCVCYRP